MTGKCRVPVARGHCRGPTPGTRRRTRGQASALVLAVVFALTIAACGSGASGGSASGTLTVAMVEAFTGPNSIDGIAAAAGCYPAAQVVNQSGGVLGHKIQCIPVDTRGDPTDAIPAVEKLLATTSGLVGVAGPESGTAASLVPILTKAHIPMISQNGISLFDHNTDPYFWRNYPADDVGGVALAYWAHHIGYSRGAMFFDNSVAAQGSVPGLLRTYQRLGGKVVVNLSVPPDSTSYGSEIHRLIQAHPRVIFTESDPQTAATAFGNMSTFGAQIPIFGTNATVIPQWLKAVAKVLGNAKMATYYRGVEPYAPNFPGTRYFSQALLADGKQVPDPLPVARPGILDCTLRRADHLLTRDDRGALHQPGRLQPGHPQRDGTRAGQDGRLLLPRRRGSPQGRQEDPICRGRRAHDLQPLAQRRRRVRRIPVRERQAEACRHHHGRPTGRRTGRLRWRWALLRPGQ